MLLRLCLGQLNGLPRRSDLPFAVRLALDPQPAPAELSQRPLALIELRAGELAPALVGLVWIGS
jgi:hypothetical protein